MSFILYLITLGIRIPKKFHPCLFLTEDFLKMLIKIICVFEFNWDKVCFKKNLPSESLLIYMYHSLKDIHCLTTP